MRTEAITIKRCCVCIPLRYGLITWGYLRLLLSSSILIGLSYCLSNVIQYDGFYYGRVKIVIYGLFIIAVLADIMMGIIFTYGYLKKNARLIKKYYYHNILLLTLFIAIFLIRYSWLIRSTIRHGEHAMPLELKLYFIIEVLSLLTYTFLQIYVTLLVRSQFIKLENDCKFGFENNATAAECSMSISSSSKESIADCDRKDANDSDERQFVSVDV